MYDMTILIRIQRLQAQFETKLSDLDTQTALSLLHSNQQQQKTLTCSKSVCRFHYSK